MHDQDYRRIPVRAPNAPGGTVWALVDADDYDRLVKRGTWRILAGYAICSKPPPSVLMHREILGLAHGDPLVCDHINGVPLDNRRANLRAVTSAFNIRVQRGGSGTSKYRGVRLQHGTRWRAMAVLGGKVYALGNHDEERDAALAVNAFWLSHGYEAPNDVEGAVDA